MGGVIGMNLVRKHPDLASALVMVDSPVIPLPEALRPVLAGTLAALNSPGYVETAKSFVATFMFGDDSNPELKASIIEGMSTAPQRLMWTALSDTVAADNLAPGAIPVPSLFVRATTQIASADEIRARYPGTQVQDVDAAHFLQIENPHAFNDILRRFIEETT
jgi:pimeloyl-ACP methyl ester carboxylesterase